MGVHFLGALFFLALELEAFGLDFGPLVAQGSAGGKISQALEVEELGGCVFGRLREVVNGAEDGVVDFCDGGGIRRGEVKDVAMGEGFENGEGELLLGREMKVDRVEQGDLGVEGLERFYGDGEAESFRARFFDALENVFVFAVAEPVGELFAIGFGEAPE